MGSIVVGSIVGGSIVGGSIVGGSIVAVPFPVDAATVVFTVFHNIIPKHILCLFTLVATTLAQDAVPQLFTVFSSLYSNIALGQR